MMRKLLLLGAILVLAVCESCKDLLVERDLISIEEYIAKTELEDLVQTESGLFYKILEEGGDRYPQENDRIVSEILFQNLNNGLIYASELYGPWYEILDDESPLIPGIREAYDLIPVGGQILALIPSELAYGEIGNFIFGVEANEDLKIVIEHLEIKITIDEHIVANELGEFQETESGIKYQKAVQTEEAYPTDGDIVSIHYTGTLLDGTEFDASADDTPYEYEVGSSGVIEGWQEGIPLFRKGESGILLIPYNLAYGLEGNGSVPPLEDLRFDIEIVDFVAE